MATFVGTGGNDTFTGTSSSDTFVMSFGGTSSYGDDTINGLGSFDTIDFYGHTVSGIVVDFGAGTITGGDGGNGGSVVFSNIERVVGWIHDDIMWGAAGAQNLTGGGGNDTLGGGAGNDNLWSGAGADRFVFREFGAANADTLSDFSFANDKIVLDATVMTALGASGNFTAGDARFAANSSGNAQDASDRIIYNTSTRQFFYDADGNGAGAKQLIGTLQSGATLSATNIVVEGGSGGGGNEINGTEGNDVLIGTDGDDTINGFGGDDVIRGRKGDDTLNGGAGDDIIDLTSGNFDFSVENQGNDSIDGGAGVDLLTFSIEGVASTREVLIDLASGTYTLLNPDGASGTVVNVENVQGSWFNDFLGGNDAANRLEGWGGDDSLEGRGGNDTLVTFEGNDRLDGGAGDDVLSAGDGDDVFEFGENYGHDTVEGGAGTDGFVLFELASAVTVDVGAGLLTGGGPGGTGRIDFTGIEVFQFDGDDVTLTADDSGVTAFSGGGDDVLTGGAGADRFHAGRGNNVITGGAGNDTVQGESRDGDGSSTRFFYSEAGVANADDIFTFTTGADSVHFDGAFFTEIGASGNFAPNDARFYSAAGATSGHDADDRVVFDLDTGNLYYDADGSGAGGSVIVATISLDTGGAEQNTVVASDIWVFNGTGGGEEITGTEGDDFLVGTEGDDTIRGLGGNDTIDGRGGNDLIDGGSGNDTMEGGLGDDTFMVNSGDSVTDAGGVDTVINVGNGAVAVWTLGAGLENLILRNADFAAGTGNGLDNRLVSEANNTFGYLDGADGNDTLVGGPYFEFSAGSGNYGNDTVEGVGTDGVLIVGARSAATVDFSAGGGVGTVTGGGIGGSGSVAFTNIWSAGGGDFNDTFIAGTDGVVARGGAGNDTFIGGAGGDVFEDDSVYLSDGATPGGVDAGNDSLSGGGGNDTLIVNRGSDTVDGGADNDSIHINVGGWFSQAGYTYDHDIDGGTGRDRVSVIGLSAVVADLGAGTLTGGGDGGGSATLASIEDFQGTRFNDSITGSAGANFLLGGEGEDTINGGAGNDTLSGGDANDFVDHFVFDHVGAAHADAISDFDSGTDKIHLDAEVMTALGASGNFAAGDARFASNSSGTAQDSSDRVIFNTSTGELFYDADGNGAGARQLIASVPSDIDIVATDIVVDNGGSEPPPMNQITGTNGHDNLVGTAGNDRIDALAGSDDIDMSRRGTPSYGDDVIDGGAGFDTIDYYGQTLTGIVVDFGTGTITGGGEGGSGSAQFSNIERVVGWSHNDVMVGGAGAQNLTGVGGNDTLEGRTGNDMIWTGAGADRVVFREFGTANADRIGDFGAGVDEIALDAAIMTALGATGNFAAGDARFTANSSGTAQDASDRVVYNTSTGQLYYDANGSAAGGAELLATLDGTPGLTAGDITVI